LEYAYLQVGHDEEARAIVTEGSAVEKSDVDPRYPDYYSDVEARYTALFAIETRDWAMAASLQPIQGADWFSQGQTLLAHAVAAGHVHDAPGGKAAGRAIEALAATHPKLQAGSARAALADEIRAWVRFAQGDLPGALALLRPVADRQDRIGKGEVELPAREMLAEMLLLSGKFAEALHEYEASLKTDPNRFNGLLGAGEAAERLGERNVAAEYYSTLLANCGGANGHASSALKHPRTIVNAVAIGPVSGKREATGALK
jgi:tetratricopeptide (TPR) repeat protein